MPKQSKPQCSICEQKKSIDDMVCTVLKPVKIWKCTDCIYLEMQKKYDL